MSDVVSGAKAPLKSDPEDIETRQRSGIGESEDPNPQVDASSSSRVGGPQESTEDAADREGVCSLDILGGRCLKIPPQRKWNGCVRQ
jgi:hypothetical protein